MKFKFIFPFVTRAAFDKLRFECMNLKSKVANLEGSNKGLLELNAELKEKLKIAQKNDKRDKKGKYTKA